MAAALQVRTPNERRHWIGYGEFPYVWRRPDGEAARIAHLRRRGVGVTPILGIPQDSERKATAMRCYASQLRGFSFPDVERVAGAPEQLWLLSRRPVADPQVIERIRRSCGYHPTFSLGRSDIRERPTTLSDKRSRGGA